MALLVHPFCTLQHAGVTKAIFDKRHVMVIGDRDALQPACSTSLDQLTGVGQTVVVGHGIASRPIMVTRRMHLQITAVKMRSLVHRLPKTLLIETMVPYRIGHHRVANSKREWIVALTSAPSAGADHDPLSRVTLGSNYE